MMIKCTQIPSEYIKWFNKDHRSFTYASSCMRDVDKFLNFNINMHLNESKHDGFCINDPDGYINKIRSKERNRIFANEGLIATYPTKKLVEVYKKYYKEEVDSDLVEMTFPNTNEKIYDFVNLSDPTEKISPLVQLCFPSKTVEKSKQMIDALTKHFELFGYYMSSVDLDKKNNIYLTWIQFEAKYTDMLADLTDILYHVTPFKNIHKIIKNGLVPYSKARQFSYNPRVYLFNKCDKKQVYDYGIYKAIESGDQSFCAFKVQKDKLLNDLLFKTGKQKLYLDPSFSQSEDMSTDQTAIFTYGNIPLRILEDEFLTVEFNDRRQITSEVVESIENWKK